ncbi:hypothetical protein PENTCL1PPCAC_872, partial [Pristionchus entomophagus]
KRYIDNGFLDKRYLPSEVRIRSSSVPRVFMSAASFSAALFKRTSNNHEVIPPIYTVEKQEDTLLNPDYVCPVSVDEEMAAGFENSKSRLLQDGLQREWVEDQVAPECSTVPANAVDAIIAELTQKKIKMPILYKQCAKGFAKQFMFNVTYQAARDNVSGVAGVLTNELLNNIQMAANCTML